MTGPIVVGGITAPDSELAREAAALVSRVHTPAMLNHVHRTWWFAEFLGRKRELKYDRELLYLASVLHDLGLTPAYAGDHRFEIDGADVARRFLREREYPDAKIKLAWDAIALHSSGEIAERREPEVALVNFGAHVDIMGLRIEEIAPQLIDDTRSLYPRLGMKEAFLAAVAEVGRKKPLSAIGTGVADVVRRLGQPSDIPNVCDLIRAAPFES